MRITQEGENCLRTFAESLENLQTKKTHSGLTEWIVGLHWGNVATKLRKVSAKTEEQQMLISKCENLVHQFFDQR